MRLGTRREPALVLVLILLTCGIYYLYFIYKSSEEMGEFFGRDGLLARHGSAAFGFDVRPMERLLGLPDGQANRADERAGGTAADGQRPPVPDPGPTRCGRLRQRGHHQPAAPTGRSEPGLAGGNDRVGGWGGDLLASAAVPPHPAPAPSATDMRRQALGAFAGLSALLLASILLPPPGRDGRIAHVPAFCPFYLLTGLPCPGCGLTRAFVCLGHGQWRASLHWHPVGWLIYGLCLLLWLRAGVTLVQGKPFVPLSPSQRGTPVSGRGGGVAAGRRGAHRVADGTPSGVLGGYIRMAPRPNNGEPEQDRVALASSGPPIVEG